MSGNYPSVSCIIPCYNCEHTLARAVASVLQQTQPVNEIILVDDCSIDGTFDTMEQLKSAHPVVKTLLLETNSGPSRARNVAWNAASGDYIAFLDADDTWHRQKLELQTRLLKLLPDTSIMGHLAEVQGEQGTLEHYDLDNDELVQRSSAISKSSLLKRNPWSTPTVLLSRDIEFRFDEDQREAEDYLLWAQILLSGRKGLRIELPLTRLFKARYGAGGLSGNLWKMERGELLTLQKLRQRGHIKHWQQWLLSGYSLAKYLRRRFAPS